MIVFVSQTVPFIFLFIFLTWYTFIIDEWKNFLARINRDENAQDSELYDSPRDVLELRFWASYRGQTLARTGIYISFSIYFYFDFFYRIVACSMVYAVCFFIW